MPTRIGPYKILEELGRGGQGIVYLGHDTAGHRVAIKALPDDETPDSPASRRLRQEIEFLTVLDHPNIAHVYEPVVEGDRLHMVMEYIEGQPLAERLSYGPLPRNDGLSTCRQIALAIEAAHRADVIHRDLKPANIRLAPDRVVKVLDFGVAVYAGRPAREAPLETTESDPADSPSVIGTYGYMSPEQMMAGEIDHRADIWSFACILFECLVGHPLFPGSTFDEVFLRVACRDADLSRLPADLPPRLRSILRHCLVRHPAGRLGSIGEVTAAIDSVLNRRLPPGERPADRTNLPRRPNTFVGRDRELAEIASSLRLTPGLSITGSGGAGKTRLALEAASRLQQEFRDGVWFIDLSDRAPDDSLPGAIIEALPAQLLARRGVATPLPPDASERTRLAHLLASAQLLLVLDECDFFGPALRATCADVHARCPHVRILHTSREHLEIDGHARLNLLPLHLPPEDAAAYTAEQLLRVESVRLFVERARLVDRAYAPDDAEAVAIAHLCRRLEGLPLAVELAGARAASLGPTQIAERLGSILHEAPGTSASHEISAGARPRHSTLDACIRWSFDLLTTQERHILMRLAVFKGGWTLEAAQEVCAGGEPDVRAADVHILLTRLVNKSLVSYDTPSGRYSMLESVKSFVRSKLAPYELEELRRRHFRHFLGFAQRTEKQILGSEQVTGVRAAQADLENFGAALDAHDVPGVKPEDVLAAAMALYRFWYVRGYFREGRRRLQEAIDRAPGADAVLRCQAHNGLGVLAFGLDELVTAEAAYRESLRIILPAGTTLQIASVWENIGLACSEQGRFEEADAAYQAALALIRESGDQAALMSAKLNFAYHQIRRRLYDDAEQLCIECLAAFRARGDVKRQAVALHDLGEIAYFRDQHATARLFYVDSIRIKDELGDRRGVSLTVYMYALALLREGRHEHAASLLAKALDIRSELGIATLPMPRELHDSAIGELLAALGAERFAAAWNRGRELFDEEAVKTITTRVEQEPR